MEKNYTALGNQTEKDVMKLMAATHTNKIFRRQNLIILFINGLRPQKHPQTNKLFTEMVYQSMLELLKYLEANQFKNFIVSGGGIDFIRESLTSVYKIPYERIIGSSLKYEFIDKFSNNMTNNIASNNNASYIFRIPELQSIDDKYGKPVNIQLHIDKIPVLVAGSSDGDLQMLEYASDDPECEYSYDKGAEKALKEAKSQNWNIVSMKNNFVDIFPINKIGLK